MLFKLYLVKNSIVSYAFSVVVENTFTVRIV